MRKKRFLQRHLDSRQGDERVKTKQEANKILQKFLRKHGIALILLVMIIAMCIVSPVFRTTGNVINILLQVSSNGILAIGMLFVMIGGGIDLSIGSTIALTSVMLGTVLNSSGSLVLGIAAAVIVPIIFALINGFFIAHFSMFPFVVTLATQLVIRGAAYLIGGGASVSLVSDELRKFGTGKLGGILPYPVICFIVIAVLAYILLHQTRFGRYVYAVGGNSSSAFASGINVKLITMATYVIMGFCAAVAGIITTARISASQPNIGTGLETDAIAACVIGGTSFTGGIGSVPGAMIGIVMIGVIYNSMNLLQINSYWQTITKGVLILLAVLLDILMSKKK